jgi:hypothetical protein
VTWSNLFRIEERFRRVPCTFYFAQFADRYKGYGVSAEDEWHLPLHMKLLDK